MANTYYDSALDSSEIEAALEAVDGLIDPANNGKVIAVEDGTLVAKSVTEYMDVPELGSKTVTENGTYDPADDGLDGYNSVTVNVPQTVTGVLAPVTVYNGIWALNNTSATFSAKSVTAQQLFLLTLEITNYTGTVTLSDPTLFRVLYSDNSTGTTRMILVNNGVWDNVDFTITITSSAYIRMRYITLHNVTGVTLERSGAQSAVSSRKCTVSDCVRGYALYVCFDNHTNQNQTYTGDLAEQWWPQNSMVQPINCVVSGTDWPNWGGYMPASILLKLTTDTISNLTLLVPSGYSRPNVCELSLTTLG